MTEERDDIIVLVDEDGQEVEFELVDNIEMNDNEYVVLMPLEEESAEEDEVDEVVILKIEHNSDDEDSFVTIEDEEELNSVFEEFNRRMEEEYDLDNDEE
ncbi:MAG: DUF1292 domain-containing protein [Bacillota bacterium]|nr:DUF1292 domain-containing protein [Bacillota bacterium]